jgi:hypothetical protein
VNDTCTYTGLSDLWKARTAFCASHLQQHQHKAPLLWDYNAANWRSLDDKLRYDMMKNDMVLHILER